MTYEVKKGKVPSLFQFVAGVLLILFVIVAFLPKIENASKEGKLFIVIWLIFAFMFTGSALYNFLSSKKKRITEYDIGINDRDDK